MVERNLDRTTEPKFGVRVATFKGLAAMKSPTPLPTRGRITKPGVNRFADFPHIRLINDARPRRRSACSGWYEDNVLTGGGLQMTIPHIQFPSANLLKQAERSDVLIISICVHPAIQHVAALGLFQQIGRWELDV